MNPKCLPKGVNGITKPIVAIYIDANKRNWLGLLSINGILPVRIICITKVCVNNDSRNQPVWNISCEAWKINNKVPNVMKSNNELIGPKNSMNFFI